MLRIFLLAAIALCSVPAHAATWYVLLGPYPTRSVYFFDSDTVAKQGDKVTVWEKEINNPNSANLDGSYIVASRFVYNCSKRTNQVLTSSMYDAQGGYMQTNSNRSAEEDVIPDTVGELTLKIVCAGDFPHSHSGKDYIRVPDNDILGFAKRFFYAIEAAQTDPAPK